jgi:AcrR family transcriptional regulator
MTTLTHTDPRERILATAYELFSRRAVRDVGVDELIGGSKVALATFYRHFRSKDDLVIAYLQMREEVWTIGLIEAEARKRGDTPEARLLAIFDVFDEWFHRDDYEGCPFVNVVLEMGPGHPITQASIRHLERIREMVQSLADEAGLCDTAKLARSWHILMRGSIVSAAEGDQEAAKLAREMARDLINRHRG